MDRKNKLIKLQRFINLETGDIHTDRFEYENSLFEKAKQKKLLDAQIARCRKCEGMNIRRLTESCPGWGDLNARIFFIGQSLHQPGVESGIPFIIGCGYLIDAALRLSGLLRKDIFFDNALACHPEKNRASTDEEKSNCLWHLVANLEIVRPELIVALGNDAKWALEKIYDNGFDYQERDTKALFVKHPAAFSYSAPEQRIDWVLKLSKEIDKVIKNETE